MNNGLLINTDDLDNKGIEPIKETKRMNMGKVSPSKSYSDRDEDMPLLSR